MRIKVRHAELPFDKALGLPLAVCTSLGLLMGLYVGGRALRIDARAAYNPAAAPAPPVYDPEPLVKFFRDDRVVEAPPPAPAQPVLSAPLK